MEIYMPRNESRLTVFVVVVGEIIINFLPIKVSCGVVCLKLYLHVHHTPHHTPHHSCRTQIYTNSFGHIIRTYISKWWCCDRDERFK